MSKWTIGEYDFRHDGWPILCDGVAVAVALYRGGTKSAKKVAEQIVAACNGQPLSTQQKADPC